MKYKYLILLFVVILSAFVLQCGKESTLEPQWLNRVDTAGTTLTVISTNEGIYPDKSVLSDPNNFFLGTAISDDLKWSASQYDYVTSFYVWATVLANGPWGEPQYYVATALAQLASAQQSTILSNMAVRAYQAILDYFPNDETDMTGKGDMASLGIWAYDGIKALGKTPQGYTVYSNQLIPIGYK